MYEQSRHAVDTSDRGNRHDPRLASITGTRLRGLVEIGESREMVGPAWLYDNHSRL